MANNLIYSLEDFDLLSKKLLLKVTRAVVAAAIAVRDKARKSLVSDALSTYTHHTGNMRNMEQGILIGKQKNNTIAVHGFGTKRVYDSYKARFFILGTIDRTLKKQRGKTLKKPYSKGYLKATDSIAKQTQNASLILRQFVNNAIKKA